MDGSEGEETDEHPHEVDGSEDEVPDKHQNEFDGLEFEAETPAKHYVKEEKIGIKIWSAEEKIDIWERAFSKELMGINK